MGSACVVATTLRHYQSIRRASICKTLVSASNDARGDTCAPLGSSDIALTIGRRLGGRKLMRVTEGLWRGGFAQVLLKKSNYLSMKLLVKVNAIEAGRVGTDRRKTLYFFWGAESKEGKVFRIAHEIELGL